LPAIRHQRDLDILAHGHGRERRGDLKSAADAEPPDRAWLLAYGILAQQIDPAAVGNVLAVEHVEAGALAGAVGADQRQNLAGAEFERDAAHGMHAAIGLRQPIDRQQCGDHAHSAVSMREVTSAGSREEG